MKRITAAVILLLLFCASLSAGGAKVNNNYTATTYDEVSKVGGAELEWIKQDKNGNLIFEEAEEGASQPAGSEYIGYRYKTEDGKMRYCYTTEEQSLVGSWFDILADSINMITFRLVMAIHPFPSVLFQMYDTDSIQNSVTGYTMKSDKNRTGVFEEDYLLISNNFYNSDKLSANRKSTNSWRIDIAEAAGKGTAAESLTQNRYTDYSSTNSPYQHAKWSVVTVLFLTCFVAEIIFITVYGYITGDTENILKELASKAGITLALFVLVSALPFLLESMRYGFCTIVDIFYAPVSENYYDELELRNTITDSGELFQLPGNFIKQMKTFFVRTSTDTTEKALSDFIGTDTTYSGRNFFIDILVWLLVLIFRFFMFFAILKAALHIAMNIVEVYLLLSLTMILTPFACFEPLKPIGAKCVMSLVTNLIECFVIMVIIICIIPAVVTVCVNLLDGTVSLEQGETIVSYAHVSYSYDGRTYSVNPKEVNSNNTESIAIMANSKFIMLYFNTSMNYRAGLIWYADENDASSISSELKTYAEALGINGVFEVGSFSTRNDITLKKLEESHILEIQGIAYNGNEKEVFKDSNSGVAGKASVDDKKKALLTIAKDYFYPIVKLYMQQGSGMTIAGDLTLRQQFVEGIKDYLAAQDGFADALSTLNRGSFLLGKDYTASGNAEVSVYNTKTEILGFSDAMEFSLANGTSSREKGTSVHWMAQILLCFMGVYIPVFFVQQSTQITNSLINGTAAMESFANAMSHMVHQTTTAVKNVGKSAMSMAGNSAKFGIDLQKYGLKGALAGAMGKKAEDFESDEHKKSRQDQAPAVRSTLDSDS